MTTPIPQDVDNPYQYNNSHSDASPSFDQQQSDPHHPLRHSPPPILQQPNTSPFQRYDRALVR
jgi:hypothetical protein